MNTFPSPNRVRLMKLAAEWRPKAKVMTSGAMHKALEQIVFTTETDKDGNDVDVYMTEQQRAAVVGYAYAFEPSAHEMHRLR